MSDEATDTSQPCPPAPVGETIDAVTRQYKLGATHVAMMLLDFIKFREIIPTINLKYFCHQWAKLKSRKIEFKQRAESAVSHFGAKKQYNWNAEERTKWLRTYLEYGELFTSGLISEYAEAFGAFAENEAPLWEFLRVFAAPVPEPDGQMTTADVLDEEKPDDAPETKTKDAVETKTDADTDK